MSTLVEGAYSLKVALMDSAGNLGTASTTALSMTLDTTAQTPTIDSFTLNSGSASDKITNDSTPTLTGTAEAGSTVSIYDGNTLLGSVLANGTTGLGLIEQPYVQMEIMISKYR